MSIIGHNELSHSKEYESFRSSIPLRKIVVDNDGIKVIYNDIIIN